MMQVVPEQTECFNFVLVVLNFKYSYLKVSNVGKSTINM